MYVCSLGGQLHAWYYTFLFNDMNDVIVHNLLALYYVEGSDCMI